MPRSRYWAATSPWLLRDATVTAKPAGVAWVAVAVVTRPTRLRAACIFCVKVRGLRPSGVIFRTPLTMRSPMPQQDAAAAESVTRPVTECVSHRERTMGRS